MAVILQKLRKEVPSDLHRAIKYYSLLSCLNDLNLTPKQIQLLAFSSVRGTITSPSSRQDFVDMFQSSLASLENVKCSLVKRGWLIKVAGKYRINPKVDIDSSKDIILQINLISNATRE